MFFRYSNIIFPMLWGTTVPSNPFVMQASAFSLLKVRVVTKVHKKENEGEILVSYAQWG